MSQRESINQELQSVAPGIPFPATESTYQAPDGYFNAAPAALLKAAKSQPQAIVVTLRKRFYLRIAAAAAVTGLIIFSAYFFANQNRSDISKDPNGWVKHEVRKVSDDKINSFIELTATAASNNDLTEGISMNSQELAVLVNDIPTDEIQSLLNDVADGETTNEIPNP